MRFLQEYSGSQGNLYQVQVPGQGRLLIECGGTWMALIDALNGDLHDIFGCLVSHYHQDHCHNAQKLTEFGVTVYATQQTFDVLPLPTRARRYKRIVAGGRFTVGPFDVTPYGTHHNAEGSVGFVVEQGKEALLFAIDTTHITESWDIPFTTIAIECSWDRQRIDEGLASGAINDYYADRLTRTHMEKSNTLLYLKEYCDLSKCRELHLIHMSNTLDKQAVRAEFEKELMVKTIVC